VGRILAAGWRGCSPPSDLSRLERELRLNFGAGTACSAGCGNWRSFDGSLTADDGPTDIP
jgi:hypothetical protein